MRKGLFLFFFLFAFQQPWARFEYMFFGGPNFSDLTLKLHPKAQWPDQRFRLGAGGTVGLQFQPIDGFAFASGIGYETRGSVWDDIDPVTGKPENLTIKMNYIQVPLICRFLMGKRDGLQPYFSPSL